MRLGRTVALCATLICTATAGAAHAATPLPGFKEEVLAQGLQTALSADWTPDGRMLFVEKRGVLKVRSANGTIRQVMDLSARVNSRIDRGLTGVAVDAAYATNNYVYLFYTYDATNPDTDRPKTARLTRIQLRPDSTVVNANTVPETVILGSWPVAQNEACPAPSDLVDCIPADGTSHINGTVRSAPDGTLFVGTGDAMYNAQNAPDPFRPLDPRSLAGKVLHIDRNGRGLPGHRYCPATTDLGAPCTKVYAMGLRNPFRFSAASRGGLWAGDVGEAQAEEMNLLVDGGSYGWPCYEGTLQNPSRRASPTCAATYAEGKQIPPTWSYRHGPYGAAVIGGPEIEGSKFPADWHGDVFAGDIVSGELNRLEIDAAGKLVAVHPFATDWSGTDLRLGPDGHLYSIGFDRIVRYVPTSGNRPPEARATVTPYAGLAPLEAHFDGTASSDPDGDALTYAWTFGDGTAATGPAPIHTYATNGRYTARLTVTDAHGLSATAEIPVVVGTRAPVVEMVSPSADYRFRAGVPVDVEVSATDPEDGTLPDASITWQIILQHNQHQHQVGTYTGRTAQFTPLTSHDSDSYYLIDVTAVDSAGVSTTKQLRLDPKTVKLELVADPAVAVELAYGGAPRQAPYVQQSTVGYQTTVAAPETVKGADGETLVFQGWSDGGAATHDITIPDADLRLVARYVSDSTPPDTIIYEGPETIGRDNTPTFKFHATERAPRYQCRVDAGAWFACSTPITLGKQSSRKHTFEVRAYDMAGNVDPTPALYEFTVVAL